MNFRGIINYRKRFRQGAVDLVVHLASVQVVLLLFKSVAKVAVLLFIAINVVVLLDMRSYSDEGNIAAAKAQIKQFDTALVAYEMRFGSSAQSLDALVNTPDGHSILTSASIPMDPWGNPYDFETDGSRRYVITSYGADGDVGGDDEDADIKSDDINNESR